jgi:hypothetical protein
MHESMTRRLVIAAAALAALAVAGISGAQMPGDPMNTMPPAGMGDMPGTAPTSYPDPTLVPPPQPSGPSMKQLFAGTLNAVLQTTTAGVAGVVTGALTGAIQSWFNRPKANAQPAANPGAMPASGPGGMNTMPATDPAMTAMNTMPAAVGMDMNAMPAPAAGMGGMSAAPPGTPVSGPQPVPGQSPVTGAPPYAPTPSAPQVYAGIAYEVHKLGRDGSSVAVDPATQGFATGDRFVVYYRPSLPGQVRVLNVNPRGEEKQIDAVNVAAGELARLGTYEFRDTKGEETLRLILVPCRTDALLAATRDIVKVSEPPPATSAPGIPGLVECSLAATRGVERPQTRDIAKVESEDGTLFALDPVTSQELSSGSITPREVTLRFRHF